MVMPNKNCNLRNTAIPFGGSVVTKVLSFGSKWSYVNKELEITLDFVKPKKVRYAYANGTATSMRW